MDRISFFLIFLCCFFLACFTVNASDALALAEPVSDTLIIITEPDDAKIFYGDSLVGYTPLRLTSSIPKITIFKNGYEKELMELNNSQPLLRIELRKIVFESQESFFKSNYFNLLLGSAALLGGVAAYLKLKADDKFDLYQSTGDLKYLDETRKYDLYSGVGFGLLQINFGILIYNLLTD